MGGALLVSAGREQQQVKYTEMGGAKKRKRNQEQRAQVCLEEKVDVGKF